MSLHLETLRSDSLRWSESVMVVMVQALSSRLLSATILWLHRHTSRISSCTAFSKGSILPLERVPLICHIKSVWLLLVLLVKQLLQLLLMLQKDRL